MTTIREITPDQRMNESLEHATPSHEKANPSATAVRLDRR